MSFATRVVRFGRQEQNAEDESELQDDPQNLAATMVNLESERERMKIGPPRASSLYDACIRQHVIGSQIGAAKYEKVGFKSKVTYGIGTAVHEWLQNKDEIFGDRRIGWWKCLACNRIRGFGSPRKTKCPHCGARPEASLYWEHSMHVKTKEYEGTGHPDLFWRKVAPLLRVVEIKTLSGDMYPKLKAPMIGHVWQVQTYMWGMNKCKNKFPGKIDENIGYILYLSKKEHSDMFPMKLFPIQKDPALVQRIKDKLGLYTMAMKTYPENLPPRHMTCQRNMSSWKANWCPCKDDCVMFGE